MRMSQPGQVENDSQNSKGNEAAHAPRAIEWIIAGISACLVLLLIGYLLFEGATQQGEHPVLSTEILAIVPLQEGYLVRFRVNNDGDKTAAAVDVAGTVQPQGGEVETSTVSFDYVPQHSGHEGGLMFRNDPRQFAPRLRVTGYEQP
jgi:uncharacterized protein (TIGR02588 family)